MKCQSMFQVLPESWSPSMRREWIEIQNIKETHYKETSPSMRREWIEIQNIKETHYKETVSLHAEGVD